MYYYLITFMVFPFISAEDLGDKCILQSGKNGQCLLITECISASEDVKQGIRSQLCGFKDKVPIVCCPNDQYKSEQKCLEYINKTIGGPRFVVNGALAVGGEFPHMAALGFGESNDKVWLCGGSLISDKFVLTAAHCVESSDLGPVKWARLGTVDLTHPEKGAFTQDFEIVKAYPHPNYEPPSQYNDIALLELHNQILFTKYVYPACISQKFTTAKQFTAAGWGRLEYLGTTSNDLMKVDLVLYSNDKCRKHFSNFSPRKLAKGIDEETQICAGGNLNETKDTCQGDSGGPLQTVALEIDYGKFYNIVGIISFGKGCGVANIPGVYTNVSHFLPWIESIVWP